MAGAITVPHMRVVEPKDIYPSLVPIKSAEVINEGDLVTINTSGQLIAASKTQGAIVKATWVAYFPDENGMAVSRTGVAGLTVKAGLCKKCRLKGADSTVVPSLDEGLPVFLGPVPTTTVSNYTCARSTTNGDKIQQVGDVEADGTTLRIDLSGVDTELIFQTSATSTVLYG
jgi:hypothetical protein